MANYISITTTSTSSFARYTSQSILIIAKPEKQLALTNNCVSLEVCLKTFY